MRYASITIKIPTARRKEMHETRGVAEAIDWVEELIYSQRLPACIRIIRNASARPTHLEIEIDEYEVMDYDADKFDFETLWGDLSTLAGQCREHFEQ